MAEEQASETLRYFFSPEQPLGSVSAREEVAEEFRLVFRTYFDRENFPIQQLRRNPTMIIGRKGAGKTDALMSYSFGLSPTGRNGQYLPIYFDSKGASRLFTTIIVQVSDAVRQNAPPPMVEAIADLWDRLFWISILVRIAHETIDEDILEMGTLRQFAHSLGIRTDRVPDPYNVVLDALVSLLHIYAESREKIVGIDFFSAIPTIMRDHLDLENAKLIATNWLRNNNSQAIILFDSIESININEFNNDLVLSGLLKAIGAFEQPGLPVQFRCCIPSEIFHYLLISSSNALKDFQRAHTLHWHAGELLKIAARRYQKFIELWSPDNINALVSPYSLTHRSSGIDFWTAILPDTVPNAFSGSFERTIPYILRHTQLLPRHLLLILNKIISRSISEESSVTPSISPQIIVEEVWKSEELIRGQIFDSYKALWPQARDSLEHVLPSLGKNVVSYGDMHRTFNRSAARSLGFDDFRHFIRMLSELGVIGRFVGKTDRYTRAVFEYSEPSRLIFTSDDFLCIHPLFSSAYRVTHPQFPRGDFLPVYPLGTDPDELDRRREQSLNF